MRSENFDRYRAIEASIRRTVNLSHTARAERRLDFVGTESCARGEGHSVSRHYSLKKAHRARLTTRDGLPAKRKLEISRATFL